MPDAVSLAIELAFVGLLWYLAPFRGMAPPSSTRVSSPPSPLRFVNVPRSGESPCCTPMLPRITISGATTPCFEREQASEQNEAAEDSAHRPLHGNNRAVSFSPESPRAATASLLATSNSSLRRNKRPATPFVWGKKEEFDEDDVAESRLPSRDGTPVEEAVMEVNL